MDKLQLELLLGDIDAKDERISAFDPQGEKRQGPAKNSVPQRKRNHKRRTLVKRKGETRLTGFVMKTTQTHIHTIKGQRQRDNKDDTLREMKVAPRGHVATKSKVEELGLISQFKMGQESRNIKGTKDNSMDVKKCDRGKTP